MEIAKAAIGVYLRNPFIINILISTYHNLINYLNKNQIVPSKK